MQYWSSNLVPLWLHAAKKMDAMADLGYSNSSGPNDIDPRKNVIHGVTHSPFFEGAVIAEANFFGIDMDWKQWIHFDA